MRSAAGVAELLSSELGRDSRTGLISGPGSIHWLCLARVSRGPGGGGRAQAVHYWPEERAPVRPGTELLTPGSGEREWSEYGTE